MLAFSLHADSYVFSPDCLLNAKFTENFQLSSDLMVVLCELELKCNYFASSYLTILNLGLKSSLEAFRITNTGSNDHLHIFLIQ